MTSAMSGLSAALYQDEPEEYVVTAALGSYRDICFASKNHTDASIEIIVSGNNTPLTIADSGTKITINSATGAGGAATSTAAQIVTAFNADAEAFALFTARLPPGSTGAGVTGAVSELHAHDGVHFTEMSLVDSGDHKTFQAAAGSRYWVSMSKLEVDVDHDGSWVEQTTGYTLNLLRGSITLDVAIASGDLVRATGIRRSELAFRKVLLVYDGKIKIDGKEIDTSNLDDDGWGSTIVGNRSWELTCSHYYYSGDVNLDEMGDDLICKFYSVYSTSKSFTGHGNLQSLDVLVANANEAQKQTIIIKGMGELYPE